MRRQLRILFGSAGVIALAIMLAHVPNSAVAETAVPSATPTSRPVTVSVEIPGTTPAPSTTVAPSTTPATPSVPRGSATAGTPEGVPATAETGADSVTVRAINGSPTANAPELKLDTHRVAPGGNVTVSAGGYSPGEEVRVVLYSEPVVLGMVAADDTGAFSAKYSLPADILTGTHTIEATGMTSGVVTNSTLIVVGAVGASSGSLAATGQLWWIVLGAGVFGLVAVFVVGGFRGWWFTAWGSRRGLDGGQQA